MSNSELAVIDAVPEVVLSNRDLELIRRQVAVPRGGRPPNDVELEDFARYCIAQRLNPFDRQIYLAHIGGRWQPYTGVHGRLAIAIRTGEVNGMEGPFYCHKREGRDRDHPPDWDELWDDDRPPHAAKFVVYRRGWDKFPVGIAPWRYYNRDTGVWKTNPPLMLGYKAITRALNLVFPEIMPPSPDREEPDIDESVGYVRAEEEASPPLSAPADVRAPSSVPARGPMIDANTLATEMGLSPASVLVGLRRVALVRNEPPPTSLNAVDAELAAAWRAGEEEPF